MRVERSLRKICATTVNMASYPQGVPYSLAKTMTVRASDVKTDISRANGFYRIGAVP